MRTKRMVAVLGCGQWGRNLVRNLADLEALVAVCDEAPAALEWVRERYPSIRLHSSAGEIFADPRVHAIVIATPSATHASLARQAVEAGKDVLVEKPLALTAEEGKVLVDLARRQGRILMVGHLLEYHPAVIRLRELVTQGELGKIQYMYSNRLNLGRIRTEENALWSFAPHDVHVILRILGEEPVDVACHGGSYLQHPLADVTMTELSFANGVRGHIFVSWLHPFKEHRFVVVGDRQMAVFDDTNPWPEKLFLYPHRVDWLEGQMPVAHKAEAVPVLLEEVEPLRAECAHFLRCVITREQPLTDGESGLRVLRVLEAAQWSLEQGGQPTQLYGGGPMSGPYYAHPTATVDPGAEIGEGTRIWHYSHVMPGATIGRDCVLGQNVFVGRNVRMGDGVKIQNNVSVYEGVELEDYVFCGPSMVFTNVINPRSEIERKQEFRKTLVKRGATLGANCTVLCGVTIGRYAFVGAGAVVTKDGPDYALVLGAPARIAGWVCQCGVRLPMGLDGRDEEQACAECGKIYRRLGQQVKRSDEAE
ncbi:MAG: Gfo/Idh/MocA family oxidoreductase [candidate division NC10 bacterium]|nr:Gfo/Idh/MocA family oxidoreductase [candidate division NC10 bacterium]